jgi:RHS repeat-associated protein
MRAFNVSGEASWVGREPGGTRRLSLAWDSLGLLKGASDGEVGGQTFATHQFAYVPSDLRVRDRRTAGGIGIAIHDRRFAYTTTGTLLSVWGPSSSQAHGDHGAVTAAKKTDIVYANGEAVIEIVVEDHIAHHDPNYKAPPPEDIYELHNDYLGSPRYITDGTPNSPDRGKLAGEQAFGPYGERMDGTFIVGGTPSVPILKDLPHGYRPITGYTGHINEDMTGLIYMRGRYYSPAWHRFVSSDQGVDPLSVNQFAYVGGMPFMAVDPTGMMLGSPPRNYSDSYSDYDDGPWSWWEWFIFYSSFNEEDYWGGAASEGNIYATVLYEARRALN